MAGQARGAERREDILAATVMLVSERGHQSVRVADVAQRLSVSPGLIIYHFATKEGLLAAAFASAAERDLEVARGIVSNERDPRSRLFAIVDWYLPSEASSRSWRLWLDGWAASQFDHSLAGTIRGFDAAWRDLIAEELRVCAASGAASIADADEAAVLLVSFLNGMAVMTLTAPERVGTEDLTARVSGFLTRQFVISSAR